MGARVACVAGGFKGLGIYEREIRKIHKYHYRIIFFVAARQWYLCVFHFMSTILQQMAGFQKQISCPVKLHSYTTAFRLLNVSIKPVKPK